MVHHRFDGAVRRPLGQGHVVGQSEAEAFELERPGFAQARVFGLDGASAGAVVAVAAGDINRGDPFELVNQGDVVDVAAVEEDIGGLDAVPELGPEFGAGFGDVGLSEMRPMRMGDSLA